MRSLLRTLDPKTARAIGLICLADGVVGASFGAITVSGGLRPWVPIVMSLLVFAGGSQFAAVGVVMAGGGEVAAVVAGLVLNTRLLPFGFAVADVLGPRWRTRLPGAHLTTDESVAFTMRDEDRTRRRAAFWACGIALFIVWNISVALGVLAGGAITDTTAFGLDAAFPTVLLALILPSLTTAGVRGAALLGAVIALAATPFLPAGLPVLLALAGLVLVRRPAESRARPGDGNGHDGNGHDGNGSDGAGHVTGHDDTGRDRTGRDDAGIDSGTCACTGAGDRDRQRRVS